MIEVESAVFNTVATALRAEFTGIFVSGDLVAAPSSFPAAMGAEMDNSTYKRSMGLAGIENHVAVMWQWEAVSNRPGTKKSECKAIMAAIDVQMSALGFVRVGCGPVALPDMDSTKYRMVARYRAVISKAGSIYKIT